MKRYLLVVLAFVLSSAFTLCRAQNFNGNTPQLNSSVPSFSSPSTTNFSRSNANTVPRSSASSTKKDPMWAHKRELAKQVQRQKQLQALRREMEVMSEKGKNFKPALSYDLPSHRYKKGASAFRSAFSALKSMSGDNENFSITKAVFTVENAFYNNTGHFQQFDLNIEELAVFLKELMPDYGYSMSDNVAKNLMIYRFFTDTLYSKDGQNIHTPIQYDFEDYLGRNDYAKQFVAKVMMENSGQCHSLPLLYLMLAEKLNAEAYLAFAPYHSYIKFPLPGGGFQNVELTSHVLTSDAHILQSGFVSAEALQSKVYLQPYSNDGLLSYCISDLAKEYIWKYGYDGFVRDMLEYAVKLYPKNINANKVLSNYYTVHFMELEKRLGLTQNNFQVKLKQHPQAADILRKRNAIYDRIDAMGFRQMKSSDYEDWLSGIMEEGKRKNQKTFKTVEQNIKQ